MSALLVPFVDIIVSRGVLHNMVQLRKPRITWHAGWLAGARAHGRKKCSLMSSARAADIWPLWLHQQNWFVHMAPWVPSLTLCVDAHKGFFMRDSSYT